MLQRPIHMQPWASRSQSFSSSVLDERQHSRLQVGFEGRGRIGAGVTTTMVELDNERPRLKDACGAPAA